MDKTLRRSEMNKKSGFIKKLEQFATYCDAVQSISGKFTLNYFNDGFNDEWLYIIIDHGDCTSEKRVNITADSNQAICLDFFKALRDWNQIDYLRESEKFEKVTSLLGDMASR